MAFSQLPVIRSYSNELQKFLDKKPSHINAKKIRNWLLKLEIQTYQILTNDDVVCIPNFKAIFFLFWRLYGLVFYLETFGVR